MARPRKGARLYLRSGRADREALWVILDGSREVGTGCRESEREEAEKALARHISSKYAPKATKAPASLVNVLIADVLNVYLTERAPRTKSGAWIGYMVDPVIEALGAKNLSRVNVTLCSEYVDQRLEDGVSAQTARHELQALRAAIRYYHASAHGPLPVVPTVTLLARKPARVNYFLDRDQIAQRIRAARRGRYTGFLVRFILTGFYSGTRPGAILRLRWVPSIDGGWIDLDAGIIHRRGSGEGESRKLATPAKIPTRLLPHLRQWRKADLAKGITHVVHYYGRPVKKLRRSWKAVANAAGHGTDDGPHILPTAR